MNTMRHAAWQATLTASHGSEVAMAWGNAHELGQPPEAYWEVQMDLYNNNIGRQLGAQYSNPTIAQTDAMLNTIYQLATVQPYQAWNCPAESCRP